MHSSTDKETIKWRLKTALDDLKNVKADDPNRINYLINRVDAAVQYGTQRTERNIGEMEKRVQALEASLAKVAADQQEIIGMLNRVLANANA